MKCLFFLISALFLTSFKPTKTKEIRVIVMNDPKERPIATYEDFFWYNRAFHDSVILKSDRLIKFVKKRLSQLQKDSIINIPVHSALIIKSGTSTDTLYSDFFFRNWKIKGQFYTDTVGDLKQMFGNFFLSKYESEWK
jgi:hypothetical protein